jgi:hypothetical protein
MVVISPRPIPGPRTMRRTVRVDPEISDPDQLRTSHRKRTMPLDRTPQSHQVQRMTWADLPRRTMDRYAWRSNPLNVSLRPSHTQTVSRPDETYRAQWTVRLVACARRVAAWGPDGRLAAEEQVDKLLGEAGGVRPPCPCSAPPTGGAPRRCATAAPDSDSARPQPPNPRPRPRRVRTHTNYVAPPKPRRDPEIEWSEFRAESGHFPMSRLRRETDACGVEFTTMKRENTNGIRARRVPP